MDVVTAHHLYIAPTIATPNNSDLLDAVAILAQSYPDLSDADFAGYGCWFRNYPGVFIANATSGYSHGFWTIGKTQAEAEAAFVPVRAKLEQYNSTLFISDDYASYTNYWSFFEAESAVYDPTGSTSILSSRLIDRATVQNYTAMREAVDIVGGVDAEYVTNVIDLVSGGQVFADAADTTSGLNPAWRISNYLVTISRGVALNATNEERFAVMDDITYVKGAALKALAPDTGGYIYEGDRNNADWQTAFYGSKYVDHLAAKKKYDPDNVFYCATCVGSDAFVERPDAPLCAI